MPQIVWAAKPDGTLDYYNRRWFEYVNLPAGAADEATWDRYIHPDDLPRAYATWASCLASGDPYSVEFRVRRADGEHRWFLARRCRCATRAAMSSDGTAPARTSRNKDS